MLRSLYAGISGMKVNQVKLDVIGNNVSNVGTTAFKSSRTRFQDMLSQNVNSAMAPSLNQGGTNANKVGLGVKLAGIDTMMTQGYMQPTSRNLDAAIDGEGYFMVSKGQVAFEKDKINITADNSIGETANNDIFYTRDGAFNLDAEGNLLNSDGLRVLGYAIVGNGMPFDVTDATTGAVTSSADEVTESSINTDGKINFVDADSFKDVTTTDAAGTTVTTKKQFLEATEDLRTLRIPDKVYTPKRNPDGTIETTTDADGNTVSVMTEMRVISFTIEKNGLLKAVCEGGKVSVLGQIAMASFKNPGGLEKNGNNLYRNSANSGAPVLRTGMGAADDNGSGYGDMLQGMLEMSNVDLAEQFTDMIVTSRAFQAAGKMITTGDEILQDIINLKR